MRVDAMYCDDLPGRCCDSCHEDAEMGYDDMWQSDSLHGCCRRFDAFGDFGMRRPDTADEAREALTEIVDALMVAVGRVRT